LSHATDPAIGDIVMLRYPLDPEKLFVKRVIASGGDEVQIVKGVLFRNRAAIDEPCRATTSWGA
jgi:signal peptidase I